ncbi:hypothetical protein [Micromonospora sp. NPDC007230]|uniref:hypothetical protein n=1 Tax=Micromonospora sp. NPDC007230 TaxID=3364237 RepID=UPI003688792C
MKGPAVPPFDSDAIAATLPSLDLVFVEAGSSEVHRLPQQWQPVAADTDPGNRLAMALALWNEPFLTALPRFTTALRTQFVDVRPCLADGEPALVYLATDDAGDLVSWIGLDPAGFVEPHFWGNFPGPLRVFQRQVHAGFTSEEPDTFGPMHPRYMETIAERAGEPDGFPDWDEVQEIASTRLLLITSNGSQLDYCVSPDIETDMLALVHEGDIDPTPYGKALDNLFMLRFEW